MSDKFHQKDLDNVTDTLDDLKDRIHLLERKDVIHKKNTMDLEIRLQNTLLENKKLKQKFTEAQKEIEIIKRETALVATIEKIIDTKHRKVIVKIPNGQMYLSNYPSKFTPDVGDYVTLSRRNMNVIDILPQIDGKEIEDMKNVPIPSVTYKDIGGLSDQMQEVREILEMSLLEPELFEKFNVPAPNGVLLHGPPGTGKTLMAKAVAHATNAKFLYLAGPELVQKYIGEGARMVRDIFKTARDMNEPVLIFIDEIDAIAAFRNSTAYSGEREVNRTLMQLLAEMDGFRTGSTEHSIKIIAATNRLDILDKAILRPGRFDRIVELGLPNEEGRKSIFKIHIKSKPTYRVDIGELAKESEGMSGADIKAICVEAAMLTMRKIRNGSTRKTISHQDFLEAIEKVRGKLEQSSKYGINYSKQFYS